MTGTIRNSLLMCGAALSCWGAGPATPSTPFRVTTEMKIPGAVLAPGNYKIRELDHLPDRSIVEVSKATGGVAATFLAVLNPSLTKKGSSGFLFWDAEERAVRAWFQPGAAAAREFVYPKNDAVAIAKKGTESVPAIDPASEGLAANIPDSASLSPQDLQIVTLWLLTETKVNGGEISAKKFQAPPEQVAKNVRPALPRTATDNVANLTFGIVALLLSVALFATARRFVSQQS